MKPDRREFLKASVAALTLPTLEFSKSQSDMPEVDARLRGQEARWTFVGSQHPWQENDKGELLSPTWALFPPRQHPSYVDDLTREDYAFLEPVLSDVDFSTDFQIRYGSESGVGIVLRAQDNLRGYVVEVHDIDARKANTFQVLLWKQDDKGFRRRIAEARMERPPMPANVVSIRKNGPKNYDEWELSGGPWARLRVRATGPTIEAWIDGKRAFEVKDSTFTVGRTGLTARWAMLFRNLSVYGRPGRLSTPWRVVPGAWPFYFEPFYGRLGEFEVYEAIARDAKGTTYVIANVGEQAGGTEGIRKPWSIGLVRSRDEGRSWVDPQRFDHLGTFVPGGSGLTPSLYVHKDGHLSCFFRHRPTLPAGVDPDKVEFAPETVGISTSHDDGYTWSDTKELVVAGKPLSAYSTKDTFYYVYSPVQRLKDGTLLLSGYSYRNVDSAGRGSCVFYRSTDDGTTWSGPYYVAKERDDTNEGMVAELPDGRLQVFMRPMFTPDIYTAYSSDGGMHWSDIETTRERGNSPYVLNHSSGAIILSFRGSGIDLKVSRDGCKTWGQRVRISAAGGMIGMTEMADGRVLVVYNIGYRYPGKIRGQYLHISGDTVEPAI